MSGQRMDDWGDTDDIVTAEPGRPDDLLSSDADVAFFEAQPRRWVRWVAAGIGVLTLISVGFVVGVFVVVRAAWSWAQPPEFAVHPPGAETETPAAAANPTPAPTPTPSPVPLAVPSAVPLEVPVAPAPVAAAPVAPAPVAPAPVAPAPVAPAPVAAAPVAPRPAAPAAGTPEPRPAEVLPPIPAGPRIDELVVSAADASRLTVKCNGMSASGTTSARLVKFPAGFCTVEVQWGTDTYRMGMPIEQAQSLQCARVEDVLRCS